MSDTARAAWSALKEHPLRAVSATLATLLLSLITWNGSRALSAIDAQTQAISELDKKTHDALGSLRDDLGSMRAEMARMQTLYQVQVPDVVSRVERVEKSLRNLEWKIEMADYEQDKHEERALMREIRQRLPKARAATSP
jgi:hypothetical protein